MNIPIPENSITINGEIYVLVDDEESEECQRCALREKCDTQNLLCQILDDAPQGKRFEKMEAKASPWKTEGGEWIDHRGGCCRIDPSEVARCTDPQSTDRELTPPRAYRRIKQTKTCLILHLFTH